MKDKIKRGIVAYSVLLAVFAATSAVAIALTLVFLFKTQYLYMFISLGISALLAYTLPFFLAALLKRRNAAKVCVTANELDTTDAEKIADALGWRIKPTKRVLNRCIRKKYI